MKKSILLILTLFIISSFSFSFFWFESGEVAEQRKQVKDFVLEAVAYYQKVGEKDAFDEFQKKDGMFVKGELYVFVISKSVGGNVVHPISPALIGKDIRELKDRDGVKFVQKFIEVVDSESGEAWVDYYWMHPTTKKPEAKITYVKKISNDKVICAGLYKSTK